MAVDLTLRAAAIMRRPVVAATDTTTARDVAIELLMGEFTGLPVAEPDGTIVGIVTELDLLKALRLGKPLETTMATDIMSQGVVTVDVDTPVERVMEMFEALDIIRVPVTDKDGALVGIISRTDILKALIRPKFMYFA